MLIKNIKKVFAVLISAVMIFSYCTIPVSADDGISIVVNDEKLVFDEGFPRIIGSGTTMVPFRLIFEALGFSVSYNKGTNESGEEWFRIWAIKSDEDIRIDLYLGSHSLYKSKNSVYEESTDPNKLLVVAEEYHMPEAPYIDETDCTLVPVRIIAETMGADVGWIPETKTVTVDYNRCGDNLTYKVNKGVLRISGTGDMWDYSSDNLPAYAGKDIQKVVIDSGVTSIGNYAFYNCTSLQSVELGDTIINLGEYSFAGCKSLSSIELPNGAQKIKGNALSGCSSLKSIRIPKSVVYMAMSAFADCNSITDIYYTGTRMQWVGIGLTETNVKADSIAKYKSAEIHYQSE
ncbi:MAG: leucine-rich repeat protein [Oscillospiraceae bacterium]|nr:leucine-rich repeat protein [Oscillospiraceae bacterium]